jgi:protein required for attachment to host cells
MKSVRTWILVADGARAAFWQNLGPGKGIAPVDEEPSLEQPDPPTREVGSDRPGRVHDRFGPGRHAMAPRVDWHRFAEAEFARAVAKLLDDAAKADRFDRLVLVAPPKALGDLRASLGDAAKGRVSGDLNKDLTHLDAQELAAHLESVIAP